MYVRVSTAIGTVNSEEGLSSFALLPLGQSTNVRVEAVGSELLLFLNNKLDTQVKIVGNRLSGNATLYVSNSWSTSALASIGSIQMTPISAITSEGAKVRLSQFSAMNEQNTLTRDGLGMNTVVPVNYSLTFDITPTSKVDWAQILHYSGTKGNVGVRARMPGIFSLNGY